MNTTAIKAIKLACRENGSDKVYHVTIEPMGILFAVNFSYGRRGSALNCGTKTNVPTTLAKCEAIFDKLVREKVAKGYVAQADCSQGCPIPVVANATDTGIRPQLCNAIDEKRLAELMDDHDWMMSEKFDGRRLMVKKEGNHVYGINRRGLEIPLTESIGNDVRSLVDSGHVLDGEQVGDTYHIFDIIQGPGIIPESTLSERLMILKELHGGIPEDSQLHIVGWVASTTLKHEWLERMRKRGAEGVVFKHLNSTYQPGRPNSGGDWLKYKFVETCSCIVGKGREGKNSISVWLCEGDDRICVGNVTLKVNDIIPPLNSVVEVRYLYCHKGGSLFQPVLIGPRDDIPREECTLDQLKYKPE